MTDYLADLLRKAGNPVQILGIVGQLVFFSRFALQILVSERRKESVIPVGFWWCSIVGGTITLVYGFLSMEVPVILGQLFGNFVYVRNLMLLHRRRQEVRTLVSEEPPRG